MLTLTTARQIVDGWNRITTPTVPFETVEECLTAYWRWQLGIARHEPADEVTAHLLRSDEFARRIPDALHYLLLGCDDDD